MTQTRRQLHSRAATSSLRCAALSGERTNNSTSTSLLPRGSFIRARIAAGCSSDAISVILRARLALDLVDFVLTGAFALAFAFLAMIASMTLPLRLQ
jgi:hypothetical protein